MSAYVVVGSGTDIGKTYVTALLASSARRQGRRTAVFKPVASGVPPLGDPAFRETDTARLLEALGVELTAEAVEACSPWRYRAPLSPDMAAAAEGESLSFDALQAWCLGRIAEAGALDLVLFEGVGGVMSPVTRDRTNLDWIKALGLPAVLVAGSYLGALSHALTAEAALAAEGVGLVGIILNETAGSGVGFEDTLDSLRRFARTRPIHPLRQGQTALDVSLP